MQAVIQKAFDIHLVNAIKRAQIYKPFPIVLAHIFSRKVDRIVNPSAKRGICQGKVKNKIEIQKKKQADQWTHDTGILGAFDSQYSAKVEKRTDQKQQKGTVKCRKEQIVGGKRSLNFRKEKEDQKEACGKQGPCVGTAGTAFAML